MKAIAGFFTLMGSALIVLNALGGVVSGLWLAFLGQWGVIGLGILGVFTAHFAIAIALLPSAALGVAAGVAAERKSRFAFYSLAALSSLYVAALITAWCLFVLTTFLRRADAHSWIPILVWSYGVAMAPWAWLASKEVEGGGGDASATAVFFGQLAYVVLMLMISFSRPSQFTGWIVFGCIMLIGSVLQLAIGFTAASQHFSADLR